MNLYNVVQKVDRLAWLSDDLLFNCCFYSVICSNKVKLHCHMMKSIVLENVFSDEVPF